MGENAIVRLIDTAVFLQARLGSTRLQGKVLKPLFDRPLIEHAMNALSKLNADVNTLLVDESSYDALRPAAANCQFEIMKGSSYDVLRRYAAAIELYQPKWVVRATGDNPAVSAAAAEAIVDILKQENGDYAIFTGLPHGCGIEAVRAEALLIADKEAVDPYEREHVCPFLYRREDRFKIIRVVAPSQWNYPGLSVTVDTLSDYVNLKRFYDQLKPKQPIEIEQLAKSLPTELDTIVIPSVKEGNGTGHIVRSLRMVNELSKGAIYTSNPELISQLAEKLEIEIPWFASAFQLSRAEKVVFDNRSTDQLPAGINPDRQFIMAVDEGGSLRSQADMIFDFLPNLEKEAPNQLFLLNNPLRSIPVVKKENHKYDLLISFGGEDPACLSEKTVQFLETLEKSSQFLSNFDVAVVQGAGFIGRFTVPSTIKLIEAPKDFQEILKQSSAVITSFGLTAFEAQSYSIPVLLVNPSLYHKKLSIKAGFAEFGVGSIRKKALQNVLLKMFILNKSQVAAGEESFQVPVSAYQVPSSQQKMSASLIEESVIPDLLICPVCHHTKKKAVSRFPGKTYFQCQSCFNLFLEKFSKDENRYTEDYFFSEYKQQYGKSYLEDFEGIYQSGLKRIDHFQKQSHASLSHQPTILDIGAAYGHFLQAARKRGFSPFGIDISASAVEYINQQAIASAGLVNFQQFALENHLLSDSTLLKKLFDIFIHTESHSVEGEASDPFPKKGFNVITMWYVIEHFHSLPEIFSAITSLLREGGQFAFSTPHLKGISARKNLKQFLAQSPDDHYSILKPSAMKKVLKKQGFKKIKIKVTGHHPERFFNKEVSSWKLKLASCVSHCFKLGDTFEFYASELEKGDNNEAS